MYYVLSNYKLLQRFFPNKIALPMNMARIYQNVSHAGICSICKIKGQQNTEWNNWNTYMKQKLLIIGSPM